MARSDIWIDGIKSQFSQDNQPARRGRKKGSRNRSTLLRASVALAEELNKIIDQQTAEHEAERRAHRNARRRECYRLRKSRQASTAISNKKSPNENQ